MTIARGIIWAVSGGGFLFLIAGSITRVLIIFDAFFGGHDLSTTRRAAKKISDIISRYNKGRGVMYDLGSCRGECILNVLKYSPNLSALGIDRSGFRVKLCRIKSFLLRRKARFIKGDIFKANISNADVVYLYLDQKDVTALQEKLRSELRPGAIIITNTQTLPNWTADSTHIVHQDRPGFEKLFTYIKG